MEPTLILHNVTIYANDTLGSMGNSSLVRFTIGDDTAPTFTNLQNNGTTARFGDFVNFSITVADNNALQKIIARSNTTGIFQNWSRTLSGTLDAYSFINRTFLTRGESACANFSIYDTDDNVNHTEYTCFSIVNTPPIGTALVNMTDHPLNRTTANITCFVASESDVDNDSLTDTFVWYNDSFKTDITNNYVLPDNTTKGQNWTCQINISDGFDSFLINSTNITIQNTPPDVVAILNATDHPLNRTLANLTCFNTSQSDADDDEVTSTFVWYNDSFKTDIISNMVHSDNTTRNQNWTCEITANDGTDTNSTNSTSLTIQNSPPTHTNPILNTTSSNNYTTDNLTCVHTDC